MDEGTEIEDRVDLDDDNYEEMDDDVEEQVEDEGAGGDDDETGEDQHEDLRSEDSGRDRSPELDVVEAERSIIADEPVEDKEKQTSSIDEDDKKKRAELLALPPHGSEIFIGGLPRDVSEEDLRDLCEPFGDIFEVRLMKNRDTGETKGFAFVAFKTKEVAQQAIEELHNKDLKGRTLRCSLAESKRRLFIGNLPKSWTDEEFTKVIEETGPGAENIELIKDPQNPSRNRGFAFIEYYNNACADFSRQKMSNASFKLDGNAPTVSWADPKITPDNSAATSQIFCQYLSLGWPSSLSLCSSFQSSSFSHSMFVFMSSICCSSVGIKALLLTIAKCHSVLVILTHHILVFAQPLHYHTNNQNTYHKLR